MEAAASPGTGRTGPHPAEAERTSYIQRSASE
jgi:hypothetical protein